MIYKVRLTPEEQKGFDFLAPRGYAGDESLLQMREIEGSDDVWLGFDHEHQAWEWSESVDEDPHAFCACAGPTLEEKLYALLEQII